MLKKALGIPTTRTPMSKGKFIGNPKGNLEYGSAQTSLFLVERGPTNNNFFINGISYKYVS
jgi:hypothetical protein